MSKTKKRNRINDLDLQESLLNVKSAIGEATGDVKGRAIDMISELLVDLQTKTSDYQDELEDRISAKPLKSVGIAVLLGLFIGKCIL